MQINPWKIGLQSARANLIPGIILQIAAILLIVGFHFVPSVRSALETVGTWQTRFGTLFSCVSYLLFCGLVPALISLCIPSLRPKSPRTALLFALLFWGFMGLVISQFYRGQTLLFGDGHDVVTLLKKVLFDQFVFTPFLSVPFVSVVHMWKDRGYRWSTIRPLLGKGWYQRLVLPTLIMNWSVWIPSLFVVYSMPPLLQPHIGGLISGFWSLMCIQLAARNEVSAPAFEDAP